MKKILIEGLDEVVYYEKLPSGLDVYLWEKENSSSFFASLNVKYGSMYNEFTLGDSKKIYKQPTGIAHFLEHLSFNISKDKTANDLFDPLGSSINAFTTFEYTSYHVSATSDVEQNINNLLDYVYTPYFTKSLVAKEKGIILEEAKSGMDNPDEVMYYKEFENLLHEDKRREKVIGSLEDIKKISLEDIKFAYDTFYHPENMFMVVSGNIDAYKTLAIIKDNMSKKKFSKYKNPKIKKVKEPDTVVKEFETIKGNVQIPITSVVLKISNKKLKNEAKTNILLSIILKSNFGGTSELKTSLIEKKLISSIGFSKNCITDNYLIKVNFVSKYPKEVETMVIDKLNNLTLTKEDFERKKRTSIASLIFLYDDVFEVNYNIQDDIIYSSKHQLIENIKTIYESLTYEDALKVLKNIDTSNMSVIEMIEK